MNSKQKALQDFADTILKGLKYSSAINSNYIVRLMIEHGLLRRVPEESNTVEPLFVDEGETKLIICYRD